MILRKINILILFIIILCSTAFYELSILGSFQKITELIGIGLILLLLALHIIYSDQRIITQNFYLPIFLIFLSIFTSTLMAKYSRNQELSATLFSERAIFYYLFYFLLHQIKPRPKDLEVLLLSLGILYVILFLIQFTAFPTKIFDTYVRQDRGTIRIYLAGSGYLSVAFLMSMQLFFRNNKIRYLGLMIIFLSIIVLTGGRQTIAIMILIITLFLIFDKKVKSKFLLAFLGIVGAFMVYLIFQNIFDALFLKTKVDANMGADYVRIQAAKFYLTDFFKNGISYITGNGMPSTFTEYGNEIASYKANKGYFLGDIGIVGNYVIYGAFFILAVFIIFLKAFKLRIESQYSYIKYLFIVVLLSILTGSAFAQGHFICCIVCVLYLIDVSNYQLYKKSDKDPVSLQT